MEVVSKRRYVWMTTVALGMVLTGARAQELTRVTISGEITGASGAHSVRVALWNEHGFLQKPVQEVRLKAGHSIRFTFDVPRGRWALSAYEDRNDNGVLDMGLFGPKEPYGFWRPFRGRRKPHFDEVAMLVDRDIGDANIALQ